MKKLIVLLALLFTSIAQAEGYIGAGIGQSKAIDLPGCAAVTSAVSCSVTDTDTGIKVFGGYQFNENGAVEISYIDLGKVTANANFIISGIPVSSQAERKSHGFDLGVIGILPVNNQFSFLGRAGMFLWSADFSVTASGGGVTLSNSQSASGNSLSYGIGAKYDFDKSIGLRAEFQRFKDVGDKNTTGQSDVDLLSISLVLRF